MSGVDLAFDGLQPIALLNPHGDVQLLRRDQIPFQVRQRRRTGSLRAHVGPNHPVTLLARIGLDPSALLQATASRLSRHIGHRARHIELPAVIDASQSAILVSCKDQRSAAMWTRLINQPDTAFGIPEGHQIFP